MSHSDYYPPGVGIRIRKSLFPKNKIEDLKNKLPDNLIVRVYGLAGVGKGTLSGALSQLLDLPHVEGSFILRGITYVFEHLELELNEKNADKVFDLITVKVGDDLSLGIDFKKHKVLDRSDLKNSFIDTHVTKYSGLDYIRERYYNKLGSFLSTIKGPCVVDSRGGMPPYIEEAILNGKDVKQILLKVSNKVAFERYLEDKVEEMREKHHGYTPSKAEEKEIYNQFHKDVIDRNNKDVLMMKNLGLGIITEDTAVLDTSDADIDVMIGSVLSYLDENIDYE